MRNEFVLKHHGRVPGNCGRGPSSYFMHDSEAVFEALALVSGHRFLDLGCGPGDYAVTASRIVGDSGMVYALDNNPIMIEALKVDAHHRGIKNLEAIRADITEPLPMEDDHVDVCLTATVLHVPTVSKHMGRVFGEVGRVLKPKGRLAVIECGKEDMSFGPPEHMRLSPEEIDRSIERQDFKRIGMIDLGYNYMLVYTRIPYNNLNRSSIMKT